MRVLGLADARSDNRRTFLGLGSTARKPATRGQVPSQAAAETGTDYVAIYDGAKS